MGNLFEDRILTCSDCHGEFIFTAGEQLFFQDKQFKNDPKRCKPCKSRRSGLSAVANGAGPAAAGLSRTETRTECSDCGVQTTVPFKPTQGRPVLCRQCFQIKNRAAMPMGAPTVPGKQPKGREPMPVAAVEAMQLPTSAPSTAEMASLLTEASTKANGDTLSTDAALVAAAMMTASSPDSSVASAADLASISEPVDSMPMRSHVPVTLLPGADFDTRPAVLMGAGVKAVEA